MNAVADADQGVAELALVAFCPGVAWGEFLSDAGVVDRGLGVVQASLPCLLCVLPHSACVVRIRATVSFINAVELSDMASRGSGG